MHSHRPLGDGRPPARGFLRHAFVAMALALCALLPLTLSAATADPAAGGTITPVPAPGANYANDNNHPYPFMVFLPNGYAPTGAPYPLVFCLHGNGEVGNGGSDGTLIPSSANQLANVLGNGPLSLIANGSTWFGDQHVIVVQPQSDRKSDLAFNSNRVDLTMRLVLASYRIDPARIYAMGFSAGGGGVARYAYQCADTSLYRLAVVMPIANIQSVGPAFADFTKFTRAITWFVNDSDDPIAFPIITTGRLGPATGDGWTGGIARAIDQATNGGALPASSAKSRCLTTHPDAAALTDAGYDLTGTIPASRLSGTWTGHYDPANATGWTWVPGLTATAGSRLRLTLLKGGAHGGWTQTFGSGGSANTAFWTWLLAQRLDQTPTGYATIATNAAIAVTPAQTTLSLGQSRQFAATVRDRSGAALSPQPKITWSCGTGGTITATGLFTATAPAANIAVVATVTGATCVGTATVALATTGTLTPRPLDTTTPRPPYGYLEYLPKGYNPTDPVTAWPLVLHLSDTTQSGDGTDTAANGHQLSQQLCRTGPLHQIAARHWDFPAIVIAAQVTTNWAKAANVKALVAYAQSRYHVDANRIYLTGAGEGANGALRYAAAYPNDPAALLTIEASTPASPALATTLRTLPLWAVHCFSDPTVTRAISTAWIDDLAVAANGGAANAMATYPNYGGDPNHYAVDGDPITHIPLIPDGLRTTITAATTLAANTALNFPGTNLGTGTYGLWNGSDALPFARVLIPGEAILFTAAHGYRNSVTLTVPPAHTATITATVETPLGYNTTAYRGADGVWVWTRNQTWNRSQPDQQLLTMAWHNDANAAADQTWNDADCWNWLFSRIRVPTGNG